MVEIGRTLISDDIFEKHFKCDLLKCKGACCIEGDSGAFLTADEASTIEQDYPFFETYLPEKHIEEIKKQGEKTVITISRYKEPNKKEGTSDAK